MKREVRRTRCVSAAVLMAVALTAPAGAGATQDLRSPDARDAARATTGPQDLRSPDARDAAAGRGTSTAPRVEVVRLSEPGDGGSGGFRWGDAAAGGGSILAVVLLAGGGMHLLGRRRTAAERSGPAIAAG